MLALYEPKIEDLWFRRQMLADEETMSYNRAWGGTISFPEERWRDWHEAWVGRPEGGRYYRYLTAEDGRFVGEIAYHFDEAFQHYTADVIIYAKERNKGYGGQGLALLCDAAKKNGIGVLYDDIAADNPAIGLFLRRGFTEDARTKDQIILRKEL